MIFGYVWTFSLPAFATAYFPCAKCFSSNARNSQACNNRPKITVCFSHSRLITLLPSLTARRWVGRQTQWWTRHKAIYFSWFGPEPFCLLLGPLGFNCWFSFAPVFQWCCSTPQGSPGVGRNTFMSSPHLCFIIVFICDLFVSRDDPLMS